VALILTRGPAPGDAGRLGGRHPVRGHAVTAAGPFDDGRLSRPARAADRLPGPGVGLDRRPAAVRTIGRWEGLPGGEPP
jgi:hypothetical protein